MGKIMVRFLLMSMLFMGSQSTAFAQAQIKFDKVSHNFGSFSESTPSQKCTFTFTNVGDQPLVINQAVASCGCTVPSYPKSPIAAGQKGTITITYNGKGKFPGHFKKTVTIRTNGQPELTRLYVEGNMTEETTGKK